MDEKLDLESLQGRKALYDKLSALSDNLYIDLVDIKTLQKDCARLSDEIKNKKDTYEEAKLFIEMYEDLIKTHATMESRIKELEKNNGS